MKYFLNRVISTTFMVLVLLVLGEWLARCCPNQYKYKTEWMGQHAEEVETLVLGSSTNSFGILAERLDTRAFNLAMIAQTMRFDWLLFSRDTLHYGCLRNVIIGSPLQNYPMEESKTSWNRCIYYHLYCGCTDHSIFSRYKWEMACYPKAQQKILQVLGGREPFFNQMCDSLGSVPRQPLLEPNRLLSDQEVRKTAELMLDKVVLMQKASMPNYSALIADWCRRKQVRVILIDTPVCSDVIRDNEEISQVLAIRDSLNETLLAECPFILYRDYTNDSRFVREDFYDVIHLNIHGAEKFTQILKEDFNL